MINSSQFITDSQLIAAFQSGGALYAPGTPPMAALRTVAEFAVAGYIAIGCEEQMKRIADALEDIANPTVIVSRDPRDNRVVAVTERLANGALRRLLIADERECGR